MQKFFNVHKPNQSMEASKDEKSKTNSVRCQDKQCGNALMSDEGSCHSCGFSARYTSCSGIKCIQQQFESFQCYGFKQFMVSEEMKSQNMPSLEAARKSSSQREMQEEIIINCSVYQV